MGRVVCQSVKCLSSHELEVLVNNLLQMNKNKSSQERSLTLYKNSQNEFELDPSKTWPPGWAIMKTSPLKLEVRMDDLLQNE